MGCELDTDKYDDGALDERIFLQGKDYPGLLMTRSLGDLCVKTNGVIAEPEVAEWECDPDSGALLLLASDGIWEFLDADFVARTILDMIQQGASTDAALAKLIDAAREVWKLHEQDYCDDITALLVPVHDCILPALSPKDVSSCWGGLPCGSCTVL